MYIPFLLGTLAITFTISEIAASSDNYQEIEYTNPLYFSKDDVSPRSSLTDTDTNYESASDSDASDHEGSNNQPKKERKSPEKQTIPSEIAQKNFDTLNAKIVELGNLIKAHQISHEKNKEFQNICHAFQDILFQTIVLQHNYCIGTVTQRTPEGDLKQIDYRQVGEFHVVYLTLLNSTRSAITTITQICKVPAQPKKAGKKRHH